MSGSENSTFGFLKRYGPAIAIATIAAVLVPTTWDRPAFKGQSEKAASDSRKVEFKSPYRRDREMKAAALRKPAAVTNADNIAMTPEEAEILRNEYIHHHRPEAVAQASAMMIRQLCNSGYTDEAFAMIEEYPPEAREAGIRAFFLTAKISDQDALSRSSTFKDTDEIVASLSSYLLRFSLDELRGSALLHSHEKFQPQIATSIYSKYFETKLSDPDDPTAPKALRELAQHYHSQGKVSDDTMTLVTALDDEMDPFTKWTALNGELTVFASDAVQHAGALVLREMIGQDAAATADHLLGRGASSFGNYLESTVSYWAKKDPAAAESWFEANRGKMPAVQHDAVVQSFFWRAMNERQYSEAEKWVNRSISSDARNRLRERLSTNTAKNSGG